MICVESLGNMLPIEAGKIVGIASHRGEYMIVACEYGLYRLWDDGFGDYRVKRESDQSTAAGAGESR